LIKYRDVAMRTLGVKTIPNFLVSSETVTVVLSISRRFYLLYGMIDLL
jgi:hypothetical protein